MNSVPGCGPVAGAGSFAGCDSPDEFRARVCRELVGDAVANLAVRVAYRRPCLGRERALRPRGGGNAGCARGPRGEHGPLRTRTHEFAGGRHSRPHRPGDCHHWPFGEGRSHDGLVFERRGLPKRRLGPPGPPRRTHLSFGSLGLNDRPADVVELARVARLFVPTPPSTRLELLGKARRNGPVETTVSRESRAMPCPAPWKRGSHELRVEGPPRRTSTGPAKRGLKASPRSPIRLSSVDENSITA
jgi:hypothetical protein